MDRFEYVMVLISIIVGLAIAHMLLGVGGLIDRKAGGPKLRLGWTHPIWLGYTFIWTVQFWWWEYRFAEIVDVWTMNLYLFLTTYAVSLFLLAVILVPRTWDGVEDLDEYFIDRRVWFYSIFAAASLVDLGDSYLKGGGEYILGLGVPMLLLYSLTLAATIVGIRSRDVRLHRAFGAVLFVNQLVSGYANFDTLGMQLRQAVCGGEACDDWHLAVDMASVLRHEGKDTELLDSVHVMTTSHEGEGPEDVAFFFVMCTNFDMHECGRHLVLHVSATASVGEVDAAVRRQVVDLWRSNSA